MAKADSTATPRFNKLKRRFFNLTSGFDMPFFILLMIILVVGLATLYSASHVYAFNYQNGDSYFYIRKQLLWVVFGLIGMLLGGLANAFGNCLLAVAFAGALAGFLVWNLHPAKVFMGDTGSLFIGGALTALAVGMEQPVLVVPIGILYIAENLSVILQVGYFKLTHGKRLFKMSPLHHHFELCGWSENKIVTVFSLVTALGCVIAVLMMLPA